MVFVDKVTFLKERSERLALQQRAPDPQPLVVTETNTSNFVTTTSTITADATTVTQTSKSSQFKYFRKGHILITLQLVSLSPPHPLLRQSQCTAASPPQASSL